MMYYPDQTFFGHNATGCINPKRRSHEFHEFSFVESCVANFCEESLPGSLARLAGSQIMVFTEPVT